MIGSRTLDKEEGGGKQISTRAVTFTINAAVRNTERLYCISSMKEYTSVPYIGGISVRYK